MSHVNFEGYDVLNKQYILRYVSQEEIFEFYTGLKVVPNQPYRSPFRTDKHPGCNYYYDGKGTLRFNDHAGYFHGDCFDAVAFQIREDANNTQGFKKVLERIAQDFRLHKYTNTDELKRALYNRIVLDKQKVDKEIDIKVIPRDWNRADAIYWKKIHANREWLNHFKVYPCYKVYLNNNLKYIYDGDDDPAYCYDFGGARKRVYYPLRDKYRFIGNTNILQGIDQFKICKYGVFIKSYKDVIALNIVSHNEFPISAVAPTNEKYRITEKDYKDVKRYSEYLYSLYDWDKKGNVDHMSVYTALQMRRNWFIEPLFFTNGRYKTINFKAKDFAQFLELNGMDKTKKVIDWTLNKLEQSYNYSYYENIINTELLWLRQERP